MLEAVATLGRRSTGAVEGLGDIAAFAAHVLAVTFKPPWRLRMLVRQIYDVGVLSLVIVCGSGIVVGMVLALQLYNALVRFGAENSLGTLVGLALIRELGPVLTGLLVTGRAGSAKTAEIGAMSTTEQLDGLRMMSIDPVDYVVAPRAWALIIVMPLLSALFICFGIAGGWLVGVNFLGLDSGIYLSSLDAAVDFREDVAVSLIKALVFGVLVAVIATYRGYRSERTSSGVSAATTSSVVTASVCVLVADYIITALWGV